MNSVRSGSTSTRARGSPSDASCRGRGTARRRTSAAAPPARATSRPSRARRHRRRARRATSLANASTSSSCSAHALRLVEPAEPLRLVATGPDRRVAGPDPLDDSVGGTHVMPRRARRASRGCRAQLRERVDELLDALALERLRDVVVVDAGLAQLARAASRASSTPCSSVSATTPWSWKAAIVSSGIVFTVSGPISSSTYITSR